MGGKTLGTRLNFHMAVWAFPILSVDEGEVMIFLILCQELIGSATFVQACNAREKWWPRFCLLTDWLTHISVASDG